MQHRNIWKFDVLSKLDSNDSENAISGIIANSGVSAQYFSFSNNTNSFATPIDTTAVIQASEDVLEGVVEAGRSLSVLMPTKFFTDNSIIPSEQDKIKIGGYSYYIHRPKFHTVDMRSETSIEDSILVSFTAIKRSGLSRNTLTE